MACIYRNYSMGNCEVSMGNDNREEDDMVELEREE